MAMVRLLSFYGKNRLASPTANAILLTKHNHHILKGNVKPEPLGVGMGTYGGLSCCVQNFSSIATSNEVDKHEHEDVKYQNMAKFAVEQHNREYGTKLKFVELGKDWFSGLQHRTHIDLIMKVIDEKGKVEYVKADLTSRRDLLEAAPLVLVTNHMLRYNNSTISKCFSDDGNAPSVEQPEQSAEYPHSSILL